MLVEIVSGFDPGPTEIDGGKIYALVIPHDVSMVLWCGGISASENTFHSHIRENPQLQDLYDKTVIIPERNDQPVVYKVVAIGNDVVEWANDEINHQGTYVPSIPPNGDNVHEPNRITDCPVSVGKHIGGGVIPLNMQRKGRSGVFILETPGRGTKYSVVVPPGFLIIHWCGNNQVKFTTAKGHRKCSTCTSGKTVRQKGEYATNNYTAVGYGQEFASYCTAVINYENKKNNSSSYYALPMARKHSRSPLLHWKPQQKPDFEDRSYEERCENGLKHVDLFRFKVFRRQYKDMPVESDYDDEERFRTDWNSYIDGVFATNGTTAKIINEFYEALYDRSYMRAREEETETDEDNVPAPERKRSAKKSRKQRKRNKRNN